MIGTLIAAARLCSALTSREVPADLACAATLPMVAQRAYPAELLAAIAVGESRLQPGAINAVSGAWGVGQCIGRRPRVLTAWAGVACQVRKLDGAADYCDRRGIGTPTCLLAGYASGPRGVRALVSGERWPRRRALRVLRRAAQIRARVERWQAVRAVRQSKTAGCPIAATGVQEVTCG